MIIKEFRDYSKSKKGKRKVIVKCDECNSLATRRWAKKYNNQKNHFCSHKCKEQSWTDGIISKRIKASNLLKFGAENVFQSKQIQQKIKNTNIERYGVENPLGNKEIRKKANKTLKENYGVDSPFQSKQIQQKIKDTNTERYGAENPWASKEIRQKIKDTNLKKYGVSNPMSLPEFSNKVDWKKARAKSHQTKKKNGSYGKSIAEDNFYSFLLASFPGRAISRQEVINGWSIDFLIDSTYIQFDGEYFHGLDRTISTIKEFKNPIDKVIYKTYLRDLEQIEWFKENNKKLVRITDKEFKIQDKQKIINRISKYL